MDAPTAVEVKAASPLLAALEDDAVTALVGQAAVLVSMLTGRDVAGLGGIETAYGCTLEDVPEGLRPLAVSAVARLAESVLNSTSVKARRKAGGAGLKSISAGPWSETYFGPEEVAKMRQLDPDPLVHAGLWALATACAQQYWLRLWGAVEAQAPAAAVQEFNYGERTRRW